MQTQSPRSIRDNSTYLDDLRLVGTTKLMGYLPLGTITDLCHANPQALITEAAVRGLSARMFTTGQCDIASGALYIFDAKQLDEFLSAPRNVKVLHRNKWPTEAHAFVHKVATEFAQTPELYDLVALCFNDPRAEYLDRWQDAASA